MSSGRRPASIAPAWHSWMSAATPSGRRYPVQSGSSPVSVARMAIIATVELSNGSGKKPSARRPARRAPLDIDAPIWMGMCPSGGLGPPPIPSNRTVLPMKLASGRHAARSAPMYSSRRAAREVKVTPHASYSSFSHPRPTPRMRRLPDRSSRVAAARASSTGLCSGNTSTPVPSLTVVVSAENWESHTIGSGNGISCNGVSPLCSPVMSASRLSGSVICLGTAGCSSVHTDSMPFCSTAAASAAIMSRLP